MIIAGGGVLYSEAAEALRRFVDATGIPVAETQAGKSAIPWDHPLALGPAGVSGSLAANRVAAEADLVIGVGTRFTDFTTMSKTGFPNPDVTFVTVNVCEFDAFKHAAVPIVADARVALEELVAMLAGYRVDAAYTERVSALAGDWRAEVDRVCGDRHTPLMSQGEVIGVVNRTARSRDVVVSAAGSLPGELHKLWRACEPNTYHLEYGYSCMGYEIAGGLGVKMAAPDRDVYVMVGDGSYLMMAQEIVTSIQEGFKLTIVLVDSAGFASIGALSRSIGSSGFGTRYRYRDRATGRLSGDPLPVDLAANAESLGAVLHRAVDPFRRTDYRCLRAGRS
jgi:3D-(3,5/4)-trihydroxycyclohexane-1,2-dione acylhydrolase (decyclizing)